MCDNKATDKLNGRLYKVIMMPVLLFVMETVTLTKTKENWQK